MKFKKLVVLIVLMAVLAGLAVFKRLSLEKARKSDAGVLQSQVDLDKGFSTGFVSKIDLYRGTSQDERIIFVKDSSGVWRLENRYRTRARKESVESLLKLVGSLRGELRSETDAVLEDFSLTDEKAIHLVFFDASGKELSHILLSPLRPRGTQNFVRKASSKEVIATDKDVLAELGIFSKDDKMSVKTYADLRVAGIESSKVIAFELTPPGQSTLVISKKDTKADPVIWTLEGDPSATIDTAKVNEFFSAVYNLYANESLDPAAHAKDFTDKAPWVRFQIGTAEKPETLEIWTGARSEEKKTMTLKTMPEALVYEVSLPRVEGLLNKDKNVFLKTQGT